jgi:hypothetical protein
MIRWIQASAYKAYFKAALVLGFVDHVYEVSSDWCERGFELPRARIDAAWFATQQLYTHYGYHQCPVCQWAIKEPTEHLGPDSWCAAELSAQLENLGVYVVMLSPSPQQDGIHLYSVVRPMEIAMGVSSEVGSILEQCPGCHQVVDCGMLEIHQLVGCELAEDLYS